MITTKRSLQRDAAMAIAAQQSDEAQEVLLPIPADTLRPRHKVMVISADAMKMKFEEMRRAAGLTTPAQS
jgi:hypothetical protein